MYLNVHSYYSLRYGVLSPEQLLTLARDHGIDVMALTDINNSTGIPDFVRTASQIGVRPLAGMEFRRGDQLLFVALARNNNGLMAVNELMSALNLGECDWPEGNMEWVKESLPEVAVIYPWRSHPKRILNDDEYLGVRSDQVNLLLRESPLTLQKMVVMQPLTFTDDDGLYLHRNLRAIDHNLLLTHLKPGMTAGEEERFMSPVALERAFADYPQILENTRVLTESCSVHFDFGVPKNKRTFTGSTGDDRVLLEKLALDGFAYRYPEEDSAAINRLYKELELISSLGFAAYFLITWDIIRYSMSRGFYHVGRGSGANSLVAYCLKITDVDPMELDLYFERFINPRRSSPPDFDIDFSWKDREAVQDYIFKRYGRRHTAFLGTTVTFRGKSVYRELGKVHGLPKTEIDALTANPQKEYPKSELTRHIHGIALQMSGFPNQRSIHAGGILISEEPITAYTALDLPPKGFPTTQWDMYVSENLGFEKIDILSQRGIGHIREAADIIRHNRGVDVDVHQVEGFKRDPRVRQQLRSAETNGCFYIESPAMRGLLRKLRCDNYLTLVAASSIIRPGVARSGMMREYIHRFHHPDNIQYLHPVMKEQLEETFGVMVYQEDVLKVCHHFAGLDLADADVLRRAMSGKFRSKEEFQPIIDKFFANTRQRGIDPAVATEVWRQIESFAGYSFSKAHSASYAVESFQSLYLKAHFPLEFQVAVINNFGGFYHSWVYFYEARRQGGTLHLPCVNHSEEKTSIIEKEIYAGFIHVLNLEDRLIRRLVHERKYNGSFESLDDLVQRVAPGLEQLLLLIRVGALRFTGKLKSQLLWEAHLLQKSKKSVPRNLPLFNTARKQFTLPQLEHDPLEDAYDEIELLGFPLSLSWFDMLQTSFRGSVMAAELDGRVGQIVRMLGLLVTIKYVKTVKNELMHFGTFTDVTGEFFDTVHFPDSLNRYPFRGYGIYLILGKVVSEFGYASVEVQKLARLPLKTDPRAAEGRH